MNVIVVTARKDGDGFDSFLAPSLQHIQVKCVNVSDKEGSESTKTISQKYGAGIEIIKQQNLIDNNTMIVFCKSSVNIIDPIAMDKFRYIFSQKPNVGIIGVAGVRQLSGNKELYSMDNKPVNGMVYGDNSNSDGKGNHVQFTKSGYWDDIVGVDDSLFAVRANIFSDDDIKFGREADSGYGLDMTLTVLDSGYDAVVADVLVLSRDQTNYGFDAVDSIVNEYGKSYPIRADKFTKNRTSVVDIEL